MAPSQIPVALFPSLQRIGNSWASDIQRYSQEVKDLYAPLHALTNNEAITVERNLAYGEDARQVLDIFIPAQVKNAGVVIFVHGGAFVRGAKCTTDSLYDNVLYWFARQGYIGVNVEYRLAPAATYPAGGIDVALAIEWVHNHIAQFGGNPKQILLIGHSAGGTHAAAYVFDPAVACFGKYLEALVLISARLKADVLPENPNAEGVRAYFGADENQYAEKSPLTYVANSSLPTLVVVAEFENPLLDVYGKAFARKLAEVRSAKPLLLEKAMHNHMSIVAHFNSSEDELGRQILEFWENQQQ
ncbi:alpha/beta hydrolase [Polynucleobacter sp. IMCC30063]|uniref:alpha/beta hydrolase n=1 Tax=Polynucleobacter sp. IMCC30063 TaxID=2907298 RepID=UPI001F4013BE|nr:alpha/beta hydrolase [Polynucleobacter sp. IMCC30063]